MKSIILRWFKADPIFALGALGIVAMAVAFWVAVLMIVAKGLGL